MKWRIEKSGSNPTLHRVAGDPSSRSWKTKAEAEKRAAVLKSQQKTQDKKFRNW